MHDHSYNKLIYSSNYLASFIREEPTKTAHLNPTHTPGDTDFKLQIV